MPLIDYVRTKPPAANGLYMIASWPALAAGDTAQPIELAQYADRSVQVAGTFDGATVTLQGSIDGANYHTLTDPQGNALSFTAAGLEAVSELVAYVKPVVSGGGVAAALDVYLLLKD